MRYVRSQWFSAAMLGLFALAWLMPQAAAALNPGRWTETAAIAVIFLVSGLSLPTRESLAGLGAWRLHLFIQGFNLLAVPAVAWALLRPLGGAMPEGLLVGLYLLAVLPTTITSCVVFTQLAGGNMGAALFNAVAGNLLGVFVSPALLALLLGASGLEIAFDPWRVLLKLLAIVALPFAAGQVLHRRVAAGRPGFRQLAAHLNRAGVLLVIYLAFGALFASGREDLPPWEALAAPLALLLPAHLALLGASHAGAVLLRLPRPDRIAAVFCAPQKTLSLGLPLAAAVLAQRPELFGLASLPILVYHPIQLLIAGVIEQRFRTQPRADAA